jgi:hypothetical protein
MFMPVYTCVLVSLPPSWDVCMGVSPDGLAPRKHWPQVPRAQGYLKVTLRHPVFRVPWEPWGMPCSWAWAWAVPQPVRVPLEHVKRGTGTSTCVCSYHATDVHKDTQRCMYTCTHRLFFGEGVVLWV